jgi:lysophospholipase L1-like esterase
MIRLKDLLSEQTESKKLRVLFVGDSQTAAKYSYAYNILRSGDVTGVIAAKNGASTAWILDKVKANADKKYDVITIMGGGNDGGAKSADMAIKNLSDAYTIAKRSGARVVAVSNPTKRYVVKGDKYFRPGGYPSNDIIARWINSQKISDVTIDTNTYGQRSFSKDHVHLNPEAHASIANQWKRLVLNAETPTATADTDNRTLGTNISATSTSNVGSVAAATLSAGIVTKGTDVIKFFVGKGLTPEQAAGIAGNINQESAFNTAAVGDNGTSRGLAQWHNERWTNLEKWCKENGFDPNSVEGQLEYLWHEMNTTESRSLSKIKSTSTPSDAAYAFAKYFERPSEISPKRMAAAETFFKSYKS